MITLAQGLAILQTPAEKMPELLAQTQALRLEKFGNRIALCAIANVKSGACSENCAFCAQSAHHAVPQTSVYPLCREKIRQFPTTNPFPLQNFGWVTSGCRLDSHEVAILAEELQALRPQVGERPFWCASLGCLPREDLLRLKNAGLRRFHHNLETARSFFPTICTTHTYDDRIQTVRHAQSVGLEICCGGIFGLGETLEQRVELAQALAELRVEEIPLNFLVPIPGTPLENRPPVPPLDILRTVALFRIACPESGIRICAGRSAMGPLQALLFYAGANGLMVGNLLTTPGGIPASDLELLHDLELDVGTMN